MTDKLLTEFCPSSSSLSLSSPVIPGDFVRHFQVVHLQSPQRSMEQCDNKREVWWAESELEGGQVTGHLRYRDLLRSAITGDLRGRQIHLHGNHLTDITGRLTDSGPNVERLPPPPPGHLPPPENYHRGLLSLGPLTPIRGQWCGCKGTANVRSCSIDQTAYAARHCLQCCVYQLSRLAT